MTSICTTRTNETPQHKLSRSPCIRSMTELTLEDIRAVVREEIAAYMAAQAEPAPQLAVVTLDQTRELIAVAGQQICEVVYGKLLDEINTNIVPQVNNMVEWVNYNTQDGGEVVDRFRRAAEAAETGACPDVPMLTQGEKPDSRYIAPFIRKVWGDDNEDDNSDDEAD